MRRLLPLLALTALASGCAGGSPASSQSLAGDLPAAPPTPSPAPMQPSPAPMAPSPAVATSSARTSRPSSSAHSSSAAGRERATASAAPAGTRAADDGDVDGDGRVDRVVVSDGLLTVTLSGGGTLSSPVSADAPPAVAGVTDVDRDGRAEVFVRTAQGASTTFLTPYRYDGRSLRPLTLDGEVARLGVGGSVTHGDGFACTRGGQLVVSQAQSDDGERYTVETTTYRVSGASLLRTARTTASGRPVTDPRVGAAYTGACGSLAADG